MDAPMALTLQIVTPEKAVLDAQVYNVTLPGSEGEFGVFDDHRPMLSLLKPGSLIAEMEGGIRHFSIGSGFAEVHHNRVIVITSICEGFDQLDATRAREQLLALEKRQTVGDVSEDELEEYVEEIARARARIALIERATGKG
jgi:F-type H+-transporting ATPase subunit epsilon